jgi:voltage-gated sodium channel
MDVSQGGRPSGLRARLGGFIEHPRTQAAIIGLIVFNAITLGLETWPRAVAVAGPVLEAIDSIILGVFVLELACKLLAHGGRFFRNGWNIFDFVIVGIALLPSNGAFAILRALRVLRVLRLLSLVPRMRFVVESLVQALPGLGSIALLLILFFYVFAVMATRLYGADFPQWFGTLGASMFSLFQIMTLEGWADIARDIMASHPHAWLFFLAFILLATFTVLNLFIAIIVNAMQSSHEALEAEHEKRELEMIRSELRALREDLLRNACRSESGNTPEPARLRR